MVNLDQISLPKIHTHHGQISPKFCATRTFAPKPVPAGAFGRYRLCCECVCVKKFMENPQIVGRFREILRSRVHWQILIKFREVLAQGYDEAQVTL